MYEEVAQERLARGRKKLARGRKVHFWGYRKRVSAVLYSDSRNMMRDSKMEREEESLTSSNSILLLFVGALNIVLGSVN